MANDTKDLLQGTLSILILKTLLAGPAHGYGIANWIERTTHDILQIQEGSLYPALRRLEDKKWVSSEWGLSDNNRRARYYSITPSGRRQLRAQATVWMRYAMAIHQVLGAEPALA